MKIARINVYRTKLPFLILLFALAAVAIIMILPKTPKFKLEYRIGAPWMHEDLYAPFDFPIYKLESELFAERNELQSKVVPLFRLSMRSGILSINSLMGQKEPDRLKVSDEAYGLIIEYIGEQMRTIYAKGVMSESDFSSISTKRCEKVMILNEGSAEMLPLSEVFTTTSANAYITSQLATKFFNSNLGKARIVANQIDLDAFVKPNLEYDKKATNQYQRDLINNISTSNGMISLGQKIISKGEVVNEATFKVLESFKRETESRFSFTKNIYFLLLGQTLLVVGALALVLLFLYSYRREVLLSYRTTIFLLLMIVGMIGMVAWLVKYPSVSILVAPLVIAPMFIRTFYDSRVAFFIYHIIILICGFIAPNSFEFVVMNYFPGVVAIFTMKNIDRWVGRIFVSVIVIFAAYLITYFALSFIKDTAFDSQNLWNILWLGGNALLVLVAYQFAYLIERAFGFLSDSTLRELTDTNQPLLRDLSEKAPGTFQHSLQVSNLAEAAALEVGGNPLLIRAGALYHDIGKMNNPGYFTENQSSSFNPHRNLDPDESAMLIIRHVSEGVQIARKHRIHPYIIRFIKTHHGTTKVNFFYKMYLENSKEKDIDERFTYSGPRPETKEEAILMLADGVEAASRSLKVYTPETIGSLVDEIVRMKVSDGQLDNAGISLKELNVVKEVFKRKLLNIYHSRVEYPK